VGRVFTRQELLSRVWGYRHVGRVRTVDTHVLNLRAKLGSLGDRLQSVRGMGYKLQRADAAAENLGAARSAGKSLRAAGAGCDYCLCAQHGRCLAGESPAERRPPQSKRTATAEGRPTVGKKRGAKPRVDVQEPGSRRRRAGRAGMHPRSRDGQGSADVNPAIAR
jgi:hypothetical protein